MTCNFLKELKKRREEKKLTNENTEPELIPEEVAPEVGGGETVLTPPSTDFGPDFGNGLEGFGELRKERIEAMFDYHRPHPDDFENYRTIRDSAKALALIINDVCPPDSDETEVAFKKLREVVMWANMSISLDRH